MTKPMVIKVPSKDASYAAVDSKTKKGRRKDGAARAGFSADWKEPKLVMPQSLLSGSLSVSESGSISSSYLRPR